MLSEISQAEEFEALPRSLRRIVFYSEGAADWPHLSELVTTLINEFRFPIVYLTSDPGDLGLRLRSPLLRPFVIGNSGVRANLFCKLEADVMVLTTPDLGNLSLKRSPNCGHYVYVFHSPVSTHMIYRPNAFDNYDTIFSVGPHHDAEIRRHEELVGCTSKKIVPFGYSRLDTIMRSGPVTRSSAAGESQPLTVVVAPSWGPYGVFETVGVEVVQALLDAGFRVIARPHPRTRYLTPKVIEKLKERFDRQTRFTLDEDIAGSEALHGADVLVSDWSGAALDYAFGRLKPVVFIDTPAKVNNPGFQDLNIEPIEVSIRSKIGRVVPLEDIDKLPQVISETCEKTQASVAGISDAREQAIYNLGESGRAGATHLLTMIQSMTEPALGAELDFGSRLSEVVGTRLLRLPDTEHDPEEFCVISFLKAHFPSEGPLDQFALQTLELLCRKTDVAGRVWTRYDHELKRPVEKTELNSVGLQALTVLWLKAATVLPSESLDLSLKFINSAGRCADRLAKTDPDARIDYLDHMISTAFAAVRQAG